MLTLRIKGGCHDKIDADRRNKFSGMLCATAGQWAGALCLIPLRSLAQAYVYRDQCMPFGIYAGDKMIGYVMVIYDREEQTYNIWHFMIDAAHQRKGYGKAALAQVIRYIKTKPFGPSGTVLLTCSPENQAAYALYTDFGFCPTGRCDGKEQELCLKLAPARPNTEIKV